MKPQSLSVARSAVRVAAALALSLLWTTLAQAQIKPISCDIVSMSNLRFGPINPLSPASTDTSATLNFLCRNNTIALITYNVRVCLSIGAPSSATIYPRWMSSGTNRLPFQIYHNAGRTSVWGSQFLGSAASPWEATYTLLPGESISGSATLYGRVPGNQSTAVPGNYQVTYGYGDTALTVRHAAWPFSAASCDASVHDTFPFTISAQVEKRCEVTAGAASDISLGSVPASASNIPGSGSISVTCTNTTPYNVGLSPSNGNTAGAGTMKTSGGGSTDLVPYQLYQDAAMTRPWGNTATPTSAGNGVSGTGTGRATSLPVYVRVPSADVQPDNYSDTVTVNVNY